MLRYNLLELTRYFAAGLLGGSIMWHLAQKTPRSYPFILFVLFAATFAISFVFPIVPSLMFVSLAPDGSFAQLLAAPLYLAPFPRIYRLCHAACLLTLEKRTITPALIGTIAGIGLLVSMAIAFLPFVPRPCPLDGMPLVALAFVLYKIYFQKTAMALPASARAIIALSCLALAMPWLPVIANGLGIMPFESAVAMIATILEPLYNLYYAALIMTYGWAVVAKK